MRILRVLFLCLISFALVGCSEPAPECWSPSVKKLLTELAKENYQKDIVGFEEVVEMEVFTNVTPQRRACSAKLVTKYNEKDGTYQYFDVDYVVRTIRGENDTYYTSVTNVVRK
ncbi:MAG: hypothetical protein MJ158_00080 [Alphaproteobacteria bacterium]|nr:hypothetical protein [Alphaproteobacteria bacterium]